MKRPANSMMMAMVFWMDKRHTPWSNHSTKNLKSTETISILNSRNLIKMVIMNLIKKKWPNSLWNSLVNKWSTTKNISRLWSTRDFQRPNKISTEPLRRSQVVSEKWLMKSGNSSMMITVVTWICKKVIVSWLPSLNTRLVPIKPLTTMNLSNSSKSTTLIMMVLSIRMRF